MREQVESRLNDLEPLNSCLCFYRVICLMIYLALLLAVVKAGRRNRRVILLYTFVYFVLFGNSIREALLQSWRFLFEETGR